jgi:hypothetical protein
MTGLFKVSATGPLAAHVEGFCAALVYLGYAPRTARDHGYQLAHQSRWLESDGLAPSEFTPLVVDRFLGVRRCDGYRRWLSTRSLRLLLDYLVRPGWCLMRGHPRWMHPGTGCSAFIAAICSLSVTSRRRRCVSTRRSPAGSSRSGSSVGNSISTVASRRLASLPQGLDAVTVAAVAGQLRPPYRGGLARLRHPGPSGAARAACRGGCGSAPGRH